MIFPTAVTGAGEGIYPWDLKPQSTMTNPTVSYSVKHIDGRAVVVKRDRAEDAERRGA